MASPQTRVRDISASNPNGLISTPPVDMTYTKTEVYVTDGASMDRSPMPPKYANYTFGAGVIVFIVLFSGTWILLISFAPGMILVDDHNNKGTKIISYGLTIMWSFLISLVLIALSSVSLWFSI